MTCVTESCYRLSKRAASLHRRPVMRFLQDFYHHQQVLRER